MMMASDGKGRAGGTEVLRSRLPTEPGDVLLWESWLRHEVPMNQAEDDRISVSFNYRWG